MPRMGRIVLPNYPHHVVQRGHNRQVVFAHDDDCRRYLADLRELKEAFGVKVYAYCLMTNHVHLLLAPGEAVAGLGQLMKALAARATRYREKGTDLFFVGWALLNKSVPFFTGELMRQVRSTGGDIYRYNPATGDLTKF